MTISNPLITNPNITKGKRERQSGKGHNSRHDCKAKLLTIREDHAPNEMLSHVSHSWSHASIRVLQQAMDNPSRLKKLLDDKFTI